MNYWLMKSEPGEFSIQDLRQCPEQREPWDGVRNYQARNMLRDQMQPGDRAFFYHSNCSVPGIAGTMQIVSKGYPDATAFDPGDTHYDPRSDPGNPRWYRVDVEYEREFKRIISLAEMKPIPALQGMALLRKGNRLSVMPVTAMEWALILSLEEESG